MIELRWLKVPDYEVQPQHAVRHLDGSVVVLQLRVANRISYPEHSWIEWEDWQNVPVVERE